MMRPMAPTDRERWDTRYADMGEVEPAAPLRLGSVIDRIPTSGRMLDLACGTGAQSLWGAQRGLRVDAVDISPQGVAVLVAAAERLGLDGSIEPHVVDLDDGLPEALDGPYDLVVVQRYRAPEVLALLTGRLMPGGVLVATVLSEVGLDAEPGPFHAPAGELERVLAGTGLETLLSVEADGLATIVGRQPAG